MKKKNSISKPLQVCLAVLITGLILAFCGYVYYTVGAWTVSTGTRTGVVVKVSQPGILWSTIEGELQLGIAGSTSTWEFSVDDSAIKGKLEEAEKKQCKTTLKYKQQLWKQSWRGRTQYFITDVEIQE